MTATRAPGFTPRRYQPAGKVDRLCAEFAIGARAALGDERRRFGTGADLRQDQVDHRPCRPGQWLARQGGGDLGKQRFRHHVEGAGRRVEMERQALQRGGEHGEKLPGLWQRHMKLVDHQPQFEGLADLDHEIERQVGRVTSPLARSSSPAAWKAGASASG